MVCRLRGVSTLFGRKNVLFLEIFFGERIQDKHLKFIFSCRYKFIVQVQKVFSRNMQRRGVGGHWAMAVRRTNISHSRKSCRCFRWPVTQKWNIFLLCILLSLAGTRISKRKRKMKKLCDFEWKNRFLPTFFDTNCYVKWKIVNIFGRFYYEP